MNPSPEFDQALSEEISRLVDHANALRSQVEESELRIEQLEQLRSDEKPATSAEAPTKPAKKAPAKPGKVPTTKHSKRHAPGGIGERILQALSDEGTPLSATDLCEHLGLAPSTMSYQLESLKNQGKIEPAGMGGRKKLWRLRTRQVAGAAPAKKAQPEQPKLPQKLAGGGNQAPTLEGRILGLLQIQSLTPREISEQLSVDFGRVRVALSRLDEDGDIKYDGSGWRAEL